jgi:FeS assembly SUF system regulator
VQRQALTWQARGRISGKQDRTGPNASSLVRPKLRFAGNIAGAMFRLSKLTDYAVVVLVRLSRADSVQTSPGISAATGIPEPTVAKVLKAMAGRGLVTSQRGARGGYRLTRSLSSIPVGDVIAAIDGPIALTACVDGGGCDTQRLCPLHGRWDPVNEAIRVALSSITLSDMAAAVPRAFLDFDLPLHTAPAAKIAPAARFADDSSVPSSLPSA